MSQPTFERLGVIGLGLVGGSVALGAQKLGLATEIRGVDPGLEKAAGIRLDTLKRVAAWADAIVERAAALSALLNSSAAAAAA